MTRASRRCRSWLPALLAGVVGLGHAAATAHAQDAPPRPTWQVGDKWVVETITAPLQNREALAAEEVEGAKLRWRFEVAAQEAVAGKDCYRIDVLCLTPGRVRPRASLWCDTETLTPRQFRTQIAAGGKIRTIQESYDVPDGQSVPVLSPIDVLPLDLPAFRAGIPQGAKSLGSYRYVSQPAPAGSKDPGMMRFGHSVEQSVGAADAEAKSGLPPQFAKSLDDAPAVAVELKAATKTVRQYWQEGQPWPTLVRSGRTTARLVPDAE